MPRRRFYVDQLDKLNDSDKSWVIRLLDDIASRHLKKIGIAADLSFPTVSTWEGFLSLPMPLTINRKPATIQTLLNQIQHYDQLPWWRKVVYFLFSQKSSFIRKTRTLVSFAGIKTLFHYKQQIDPLTYRGIKTMLQKHEPKVPYQLGEITRAFFGDHLEEINNKKDVVLRKKDENEQELLKKNKNHLNSVYQSAKEQLQSVLSDTIRFPDKKSQQLEWATIRQGLEKEVSAIEEYYKVAHWDKGSDECLPNDWLLSAQAGIEFIKRTHEEFELAPLIKRINAPDIKWQRAKRQRKKPQLVMGSHKTPEVHRQIVKWADAQLPYRPLFPDQASRWVADKQDLLAIFKPLFDEILGLKEANASYYVAKQRALAEKLGTLIRKQRLHIETTYSQARAKKLLIPFDNNVYQEIELFFNQLAYIVDHIDEVLHQHLQNERHSLLQEILNKSDMILETLAEGESYLRNMLRQKEEYIQLAERTLARMDQCIADAGENKKGFAKLQEQVIENGYKIEQMVKDTNESKARIDALVEKADALVEKAGALEEKIVTDQKEMDIRLANSNAELKQLKQQVLALLNSPELKDIPTSDLPDDNRWSHTSQQQKAKQIHQQSRNFLLFKSNLTTQTPLLEFDVSDNFYKY